MSTAKIRAQALKELEDRYGRVTARQLLEAARNKKHPLHREFEWNDSKAAERYRLIQAGEIIRSVRVKVIIDDVRVTSVGYVHDPAAGPNGEGYRHIAHVRSEHDTAIETLEDEIARIVSLLERAKEIAVMLQLEPQFRRSMESTLDLLTAIRRRRSSPSADEPEARA